MNQKELDAILNKLTDETYPRFPMQESTKVIILNGKNLRAISRINRGRSGKGTTTLFYVNGDRVARKNIMKAVFD